MTPAWACSALFAKKCLNQTTLHTNIFDNITYGKYFHCSHLDFARLPHNFLSYYVIVSERIRNEENTIKPDYTHNIPYIILDYT